MTIKEFSRLCGCNPQTLRYYDHMDLLKPVEVDKYSGYRYYNEEQALIFVKIKNLQSAGFTIGEIKTLLDQDNDTICEAFTAKIAEQEEKLRKLRRIRQSYRSEMNQMREKVQQMRQLLSQAMSGYDYETEFGLDDAHYREIIGKAGDFFEQMVAGKRDDGDLEYSEEDDGGELDFLNNPEYETVYEKHGWGHIKDILEEFDELGDGKEYALYCEVAQDKNHAAFASLLLGVLLEKNPGETRKLGCNVKPSQDGENHLWLLRRRA